MPAMLGEIVEQMLGDDDAIVVGRSAPGGDPLADARRSNAELLVVRSHPDGDSAIDRLFASPVLGILLISDDGRAGSLLRLAHAPVTLDRASIAGLAQAIRGGAAGHA